MAIRRLLFAWCVATLAAGQAAACVVGVVAPVHRLPFSHSCMPCPSVHYWAGWYAPQLYIAPLPVIAPLDLPAEQAAEPVEPPVEPPAPARQPLPLSGAQVDLAWRFIGLGDAHFAKQKFLDANDRYRKAKNIAPQLPAAHVRHAFSLVATGRYDFAAAALKRGLELDRTWPKADFRIAQLYADNQMAKVAHLDALAQRALDAPDNADLLFLVGAWLWFDGERQRAAPFFRRARALTRGPTEHIEAFLNVE